MCNIILKYKIFYLYITSLSAWLHRVVTIVVIDNTFTVYRTDK